MSFDLKRDPQGRLIFRPDTGDEVVDVRVRRAFPWSDTSHFISLRNSDGKEIALVEDLATLGPDQRRLIDEFLTAAVFIPRITRVTRVDLSFGFQIWSVETDRGPIEFRLQEREDLRFLPDGRFSLKDADGNVYELPRLDQLDEHSRRAVEHIL